MINIYTDGACKGNPGPGGYAFKIWLEDGTVISRAYGVLDTTNNRMELNAVITALKTLIDAGHKQGTACTIYTDSNYVYNPFAEKWLDKWINIQFKGIKNVDMWRTVVELREYFDLTFVKVKGHSTDEHNIAVDIMASNACSKRGLVESHILKIDTSKHI